MKYSIIQPSILIFMLMFTACANKKCETADAYNGLYNALTCDYEAHIETLNTNVNKLDTVAQFNAYQELLAKVNHKENELALYKQKIAETDALYDEIEANIEKMDTKLHTKKLLKRIKSQVISMRDNINHYQPYYNHEEIKLAKKYIESNQEKSDQTTQLAKAFVKKHTDVTVAYNKNYQKNRETQKELQRKLNQSIKSILIGEKAKELTPKSKILLQAVLEETKRYTSSIK